MATAKKLSWIKECLVNNWQNCTEEELAAKILAENATTAADDERKATVQMARAWQNNEFNVRGKFQILKQHDSEELLEKFIQEYAIPRKY